MITDHCRSWPGAQQSMDKIPTRILYNSDGTVAKWGSALLSHEECLQYIKLLLDDSKEIPQGISREGLLRELKELDKSPQEVATDFLLQMHTVVVKEDSLMRKRYGDINVWNSEINWVLTVPAIWSDAAKDLTRQAAINSGMGHNLMLVTEPEAAAVYTLTESKSLNIRTGEIFVICDVGGGTTDLTTFSVEKTSPLRFCEVVGGQGALQGGAFVDAAFKSFVRESMGPANYDAMLKMPYIWEAAMDRFQRNVKTQFNPYSNNDYAKSFWIRLDPRFDNKAAGIKNGHFTLTTERLRQMFDPTVEKVLEMIEQQVAAVKEFGEIPRGIILVGGFGQSPYLYHRVKERFGKTIQTIQPNQGETAVVQGAVLQAVSGGGLVTSRKARRAYGVPAWKEFDPKKHKSEKHWDPIEERHCIHNGIEWFIKKGQNIKVGEIRTLPYKRHYPNDQDTEQLDDIQESLYAWDGDNPPEEMTNRMKPLCYLKVDRDELPKKAFKLRATKSGEKYMELSYELGMSLDSGFLEFDLRIKDQVLGTVVAKFT